MMYWDTSAVVKLYAREQDSGYFLNLIAGTDEQVVTSAIASMELFCALERKERSGDIKPGGAGTAFDQFLNDIRRGRIIEIPYGHYVIQEARKLIEPVSRRRILIRTLDRIHIASAVAVKATWVVATDSRLRQVASLANLKLFPD